MTDGQELERGIERVAAKVDALAQSFDTGFVEQREYTEFAFEQLRTDMLGRFDQMDARVGRMDAGFGKMEARFGKMEARFDRLERKLDQFIDRQTRANELTERRLQLLEPPISRE